jgi:hypothetical protein
MRIFLRVEFPESKRVEVKFKSIKERSRALAVVVAGDRSHLTGSLSRLVGRARCGYLKLPYAALR